MPQKKFPENVTFIGKFLEDSANVTYKYESMESHSVNKTLEEPTEQIPTATFNDQKNVLAEDLMDRRLYNILEEGHGPEEDLPGGRSQLQDSNSCRLASMKSEAAANMTDIAPSSLATDFEKQQMTF